MIIEFSGGSIKDYIDIETLNYYLDEFVEELLDEGYTKEEAYNARRILREEIFFDDE